MSTMSEMNEHAEKAMALLQSDAEDTRLFNNRDDLEKTAENLKRAQVCATLAVANELFALRQFLKEEKAPF